MLPRKLISSPTQRSVLSAQSTYSPYSFRALRLSSRSISPSILPHASLPGGSWNTSTQKRIKRHCEFCRFSIGFAFYVKLGSNIIDSSQNDDVSPSVYLIPEVNKWAPPKCKSNCELNTGSRTKYSEMHSLLGKSISDDRQNKNLNSEDVSQKFNKIIAAFSEST